MLKLYYSLPPFAPYVIMGDSMRTWRNRGGKAVGHLMTKIIWRRHFGRSQILRVMNQPSESLESRDLSTSVTFNDTSGCISGSFCCAYINDASPVRRGVWIKPASNEDCFD
ncbi:hypothetical protein TNCV_5083601 [Trichonephila clavipes]|uniref:Uncharacterized protein n=1 Tax=Trichonephila clavipes TaxID=2585209 RepID=A0A8X6S8E9_TRICX|nr:hypothetical protein TNCV_5083601 [Trichonephila clavipes]